MTKYVFFSVRLDEEIDRKLNAFVDENPHVKSKNNLLYLILRNFFERPENWEIKPMELSKAGEE